MLLSYRMVAKKQPTPGRIGFSKANAVNQICFGVGASTKEIANNVLIDKLNSLLLLLSGDT